MKSDITRYLAILCGIVAIVATVCCVANFFISPTGDLLTGAGVLCFKYFTVDSNILCALSFIPALYFAFRKQPFPRWLSLFRLAGTVSVTITLCTVLGYLGPRLGYIRMFSGTSFWLHGLCPLLAIFSYCFLERHPMPKFADIPIGMLPMIVYAFVYLYAVVIVGVWEDFYSFNVGGKWPLFFAIMFAAAALISLALLAVRKAVSRRKAD